MNEEGLNIKELQNILCNLPDGEIHLIPIQEEKEGGDEDELSDGSGIDPDGQRPASHI